MANLSEMIKNRTNNRPEIVGPIKIRTINDIKKAIIPFIKETSSKKVEFSSDLEWKDEDGNTITTKLSAYSTDPDLRSSLLNGFNQVKEHNQLWNNLRDTLDDDEYGTSLPHVDIDNFIMPVDKLIKNRLGGKRQGMKVVWKNIENKNIVFDPYNKTLEIQ